jgi:predicted dehydrogenase
MEIVSPEIKVKRSTIAFVGVGLTGRHRMQAVAEKNICDILAIADTSDEMMAEARKVSPKAKIISFEEILEERPDGIVIATPSALHADQAFAALEQGIAVFCQKPLGRNCIETTMAVDAARRNNCLLHVDLSFRQIAGLQQVKEMISNGELGEVFNVNLVFHNAYGPDKDWFYNPKLSGGGCLIDLGVHLTDLALWMLNFPEAEEVFSRFYRNGKLLSDPQKQAEDFASAKILLSNGTSLDLTCSWKIHAGTDAVIEATFFGTKGGISIKNINGSFYDFTIEKYSGTSRQIITQCDNGWGGRATIAWTERLLKDKTFDPVADQYVAVAEVLDKIYGRNC